MENKSANFFANLIKIFMILKTDIVFNVESLYLFDIFIRKIVILI